MKAEHYDAEDLFNMLDTREGFYGLLAQCYLTEPAIGFLKELGDQIHIIKANGLFKDGADLLEEYFKQWGQAPEDRQRELAREFVYLFVAPGSHRVQPYESVYCSRKRLYKQGPYDKVVKALRDSGLGKKEDCKELEDHISIELEYMEFLCSETKNALADKDMPGVAALMEKQRVFLLRHLLKWAPGFCKKVCREAKSQFYEGIALITDAFLASETGRIKFIEEHAKSLM